MRQRQWIDGLKAGRSMATNGPLLGLTVNGQHPGSIVNLDDGDGIRVEGFMRSAVPIDHVELVVNGEVVRTVDTDSSRMSADLSGEFAIEESGWVLLRAWNDTSHPMIFDLYPYGTTTPVYINVADQPARSPDDAAYFISWISKIRESVEAHTDYNSPDERAEILANLAAAEARFEACR